MNIYITDYLAVVSTYYHSGGWAVIVAESRERARELYEKELRGMTDYIGSPELDEDTVAEALKDFDTVGGEAYSLSISTTPERIDLLPDTGCC